MEIIILMMRGEESHMIRGTVPASVIPGYKCPISGKVCRSLRVLYRNFLVGWQGPVVDSNALAVVHAP